MRQPCFNCAIWPCICGAEAPRDMAGYDAACDGLIPPCPPDTGFDGFDDARGGLPDADRLAAPVFAPFHNPGDTP